jgi:VWFA-related protein
LIPLLLVAGSTAHAQTLRSGVILVPVDVRVVDAKGNPITDLTRADFQVFEDGVPQEIAHFEKISFAGDAAASSELPELTTTYRTFILLLGRGRINHPAKGLDHLIDFVRDSLLPGDRVGVVAYLRMSEPTTDHAAVLRFLTGFRERHERLDYLISLSEGPEPTFPPSTRKAIDEVFSIPGIPAFRELPGGTGNYAFAYGTHTNLRWALDAARRMPGEKHMIVVSDRPMGIARINEEGADNYWVRKASGARVALSYIHTAGLTSDPMGAGRIGATRRLSPQAWAAVHLPGDHRFLAGLTGGVSSFYSYAAKPLDALERASRVQYLIGYYPKQNLRPDAQRRIKVVINRPQTTAMYRQAYQAEAPPTEEADFRNVASGDRIDRTLEWLTGPQQFLHNGQAINPPKGLRLSIAPTREPARDVVVRIAVDPTRVLFTEADGQHSATIDIAVLAQDAESDVAGEWRGPIQLELSAADFRRTKREWIEFDVNVPLSAAPRQVWAVVYQYETNRTSTGSVRVK